MRLLIVGAGSTGGYFGGRLAAAGRDVTFLVRPARAARLRERGLEILSPKGDLTLTPTLVTADTIAGPFDAILLTVKGYALDAALDDLAPAVGPETMILPVLNGMKHVETIRARFGRQALVGCVCKIATQLDAEGRIRHMTPLHDLVYGEMDGTVSARLERLDLVLKDAGFDARLSTEIERELWEKWVLLATLGGITCLMRGPIGAVEAAPGGAPFARALLDEVVSIVRAAGTPPSQGFLDATRALMTQPGSPMTSSMYRDLQAGLPVEADQILGDLLLRGAAHGLAAPLLAAAYTHLSVYQARLAR